MFLFFETTFAQQKEITGKVVDSAAHIALNGVTVLLSPGNRTDITNESGHFFTKTYLQKLK